MLSSRTKQALPGGCPTGPADVLPALAWLSLARLLLSRALLRFTRHSVIYQHVCVFAINDSSVGQQAGKSAACHPMMERGLPISLGKPVAETDPLHPILPAALRLGGIVWRTSVPTTE
jgi:hypothetical protein